MIRKGWIAAWLAILFVLLMAAEPMARHRHGGGRVAYRPRVRVAFVGGFGPRFYGGYGYGRGGYRYYGGYYPGAGPYGTIDFNVTPKESMVYVDGALIGSADDFNGGFFGDTARIAPGAHDIKLVAPDGTEVNRRVYVMPGRELNFNYRF